MVEFSLALQSVMKNMNYQFQDIQLLERSLTHRSAQGGLEAKGGGVKVNSNNETLEYLGDAVLDLVLAELLMSRFPNDAEGPLSKKRASLVNEQVLADCARRLDLQSYLRLGPSEEKNRHQINARILSSAFEALVGAVFLDAGYLRVREFVVGEMNPVIDETLSAIDFENDFKTRLQEYTQKIFRETPEYEILQESGPSHLKSFEMAVKIKDRVLATGLGGSKKQAAQVAAEHALKLLMLENEPLIGSGEKKI